MNAFRSVQVHASKRHLQNDDGSPFFWLGDTAWELFHRLTRPEIVDYLSVRHQQGFNVVQAVALAELDGLRTPNREGQLPFRDMDPTKPNEPYWDLVDYAFRVAEQESIHIGLLPTWGDKINKMWGVGPEIFNPANAHSYGEFLGKRYGKRKNLIWIMGGDRPLEPNHVAIIRAMAEGIRATESFRHLMTLHTSGGASSSKFVHKEDWLDMNMIQTSHFWFDNRGDRLIQEDLALEPKKPTLDGEPNYENHRPFKATGEFKDMNIPPFTAYHVRRAAYQSVFAGGCGVTYGCHAVWQFAQPDLPPVNSPIGTWKQSLQLPGARQMTHLMHLMLGMGLFSVEPDPSLISFGTGDGPDVAVACRSKDGSHAAIYVPWPRPLGVHKDRIKAGGKWSWFDPRTGQTTKAEEKDSIFDAPTAEDWVLIYR